MSGGDGSDGGRGVETREQFATDLEPTYNQFYIGLAQDGHRNCTENHGPRGELTEYNLDDGASTAQELLHLSPVRS
jgi:hypothetical protein